MRARMWRWKPYGEVTIRYAQDANGAPVDLMQVCVCGLGEEFSRPTHLQGRLIRLVPLPCRHRVFFCKP